MADFYTDQNGVRVPVKLYRGTSLNAAGLLYSKSVNGVELDSLEEDIDGSETLSAELASLGL